jgi:hypothetical protein
MASFMTSRITSEMPPMPDGAAFGPPGGAGTALQLPGFLREPFSVAMSQSMLLPAFIALFGVVAAMFMLGFTRSTVAEGRLQNTSASGAGHYGGSDAPTRRIRLKPNDFVAGGHDADLVGHDEFFDDDDDYVEYVLSPVATAAREPLHSHLDNDQTEPLPVHVVHPPPVPDETWHSAPVEAWRSLLDEDPDPAARDEAIGFAHNGFHVDDEQRFRPIDEVVPPPRPSRRELHEDRPEPPQGRNRHYRADPDDSAGYGRHSFRDR